MKKLYVGNLPWSVNDSALEELFADYGPVHSAVVISDRMSGRSKGFGFVELDDAMADKALAEMNGHEIEGRALKLSEARERERR